MDNKIFIDTWGWLTLNDRGERRHKEVVNSYRNLIINQTTIYTTSFVLDETFTLFFKRISPNNALESMLQLSRAFESPRFNLIHIDKTIFSEAQVLRIKYLDKPQISFTDLTSIVVMQELKIYRILTEDKHFNQVGLGFQLEP